MKTQLLSVGLVGALACLVSGNSHAAGARASRSEIVRDVVVSSHSSSERSSRGAGGGFGMGFASYSSLTNVSAVSVPAMSLGIDVGQAGMIQAMFGLSSASPINFGVGAEYKHIVAGSRAGGFHLGGGFGLGTTGVTGAVPQFFLSFNAVAGVNFVLPNVNNIQIDFDFGPQVGINLANSTASLNVGGFSSVYGMSIHYFF